MFTQEPGFKPIRSNRTNLDDARLALGETAKSVKNKPFIQRKEEPKKKIPYCSVCEDLESSARNIVLRCINKHAKKLHFNKTELSILIRLYLELLGNDINKELSISDFKQFLISTLGILDSYALDGIVRAVKVGNRNKSISVDEFLTTISILLRGTLNERIDFAFKVMDIDGDGLFRKPNEFVNLIANSYDPQIAAINPDLDPEEPERDTVTYLHHKFMSKNVHVNVEDFRRQVLQEPLLLECFFPFLPDMEKSMSFQEVLMTKCVIKDSFLPKEDSINFTRKQSAAKHAD